MKTEIDLSFAEIKLVYVSSTKTTLIRITIIYFSIFNFSRLILLQLNIYTRLFFFFFCMYVFLSRESIYILGPQAVLDHGS